MGWFMIYNYVMLCYVRSAKSLLNWFTVSTHLFRFELYPSDEALFSITTETVLPLTKLTHLGCSLTCLLTSSSDTVESDSVESSVITHISTTRLMLQLISSEVNIDIDIDIECVRYLQPSFPQDRSLSPPRSPSCSQLMVSTLSHEVSWSQ